MPCVQSQYGDSSPDRHEEEVNLSVFFGVVLVAEKPPKKRCLHVAVRLRVIREAWEHIERNVAVLLFPVPELPQDIVALLRRSFHGVRLPVMLIDEPQERMPALLGVRHPRARGEVELNAPFRLTTEQDPIAHLVLIRHLVRIVRVVLVVSVHPPVVVGDKQVRAFVVRPEMFLACVKFINFY